MRDLVRSTVFAIAVAGLTLSAAALPTGNAFAQAKRAPVPAEATPPADAPMKQVALTEKQIQGVLAAQKDMAALDDKGADSPNMESDGKVVAELEASEAADGFRFTVELVEPEDRLASDLDDLGRERLGDGELVPDLRERTYQRLGGIRGGSQVGAGHAVRLQPAFVVGRCP